MSAGPRLLADIGGTHARFAWQCAPGAAIEALQVLPCAAFASLLDAARHYLAGLDRPAPLVAGIGIANPVTGDEVRMTNHHWSFSIQALRQALGLQRLLVVNDFTALARALPVLEAAERRQLFGAAPVAGAPIALLGAGTGLGVSALVPAGADWVPLETEGGHVTLSAVTPREAAVVGWLQRRFGHASAERAVSGPGLVWLHEALCALDAAPPPAPCEAADITRRAMSGEDARCAEALALFFAFLGSTAGNLALSLGARGGIYLGGGILPRLAGPLLGSVFHQRLVGKGRFSNYLAGIPVVLIDAAASPALRGVSLLL